MMRTYKTLRSLLIVLFLLIIIPLSSAYRVYYDKGVDRTVYDQVIKFIPDDCSVRVDVVSRNNIFYDGYAYYSGRIIIYDGNKLDYQRKVYVLEHEIGHVCNQDNRCGSYFAREVNADKKFA